MRDEVVLDFASNGTRGGDTSRRRRASASCHDVGEGAIAESCRPTSEQVICAALRLALVATQMRILWHAGAITAERAMQLLDQASREQTSSSRLVFPGR